MTKKTEFLLVPPNVTLSSPAAISRLPGVADECAAEGRYRGFDALLTDSSEDSVLSLRVVVNGQGIDNYTEPPTGEIERPTRFCLEASDFTALCTRVELYVSHGFQPARRGQPPEPVVAGDMDVAVWFVGREPETPDPSVDIFDACLAMTAVDPAEPGTSESNLGTNAEAGL